MDSAAQSSVAGSAPSASETVRPANNHGNGLDAWTESEYLSAILASLQTMRDGDFSVRLPVAWTGLPGKIADHFNEIVSANEQMARELKRIGQAVGKEGKT